MKKFDVKSALITFCSCALLFGLIYFVDYNARQQKYKPERIAVESLRSVMEVPNSLRMKSISKPIPVYGRKYITDSELTEMLGKIEKVSELMMNKMDDGVDYNSPEVQDLMTRQIAASAMLRSMNDAPMSKSQTGWKIKLSYSSKSKRGVEQNAEYWAIMDKDCRYIINSFEVPVI